MAGGNDCFTVKKRKVSDDSIAVAAVLGAGYTVWNFSIGRTSHFGDWWLSWLERQCAVKNQYIVHDSRSELVYQPVAAPHNGSL